MKIQIIGYKQQQGDLFNVETSTLSAPKSLDEFDVNIVDLTSSSIWKYSEAQPVGLSCLNDFKSIQTMVEKKSISKIIYQLPKNGYYQYYLSADRTKYYEQKVLKDMLNTVQKKFLSAIVPNRFPIPALIFENTRSKIGDIEYLADFYFDTNSCVVTESVRSKKATTVFLEENSIYLTTLNVASSNKSLETFLSHLFCKEEQECAPAWVRDFKILDDDEQFSIIQGCQTTIDRAKADIDQAEEKLNKNARYKSILYTNSDKLVKVVFEILEQLFNCDLSNFIDEGKEDFLIKKNSLTFIGEIKGVTSNVKNEHISQVDVHYQGYMDKLEENQCQENVHQLLIINPFRTKPITEREPVNEQQIVLAMRNSCLIIETVTLLRVFELHCRAQISTEKCIDVFSNHIGLLKESDFFEPTEKELEAYKM